MTMRVSWSKRLFSATHLPEAAPFSIFLPVQVSSVLFCSVTLDSKHIFVVSISFTVYHPESKFWPFFSPVFGSGKYRKSTQKSRKIRRNNFYMCIFFVALIFFIFTVYLPLKWPAEGPKRANLSWERKAPPKNFDQKVLGATTSNQGMLFVAPPKNFFGPKFFQNFWHVKFLPCSPVQKQKGHYFDFHPVQNFGGQNGFCDHDENLSPNSPYWT